MKETKLKRGIIISLVVTFVLLIGMVVAWNMVLIRPLKEEIAKAQDEYKKEKTDADRLKTALEKQAQAEQNAELVNLQLAYFRRRYRSLNFTDDMTKPGVREAVWLRYMNEYFADYGLELRRELIQVANETGVVINTSVKVDPPPQLPEQVAPPPSGYLKPVTGGALATTVTGPLPDIMRFLNRISQSPILMAVGNVKLDGFSPNIKASFTITPYLVGTGNEVKLPAGAAPAAPAGEGETPPGETPPTP